MSNFPSYLVRRKIEVLAVGLSWNKKLNGLIKRGSSMEYANRRNNIAAIFGETIYYDIRGKCTSWTTIMKSTVVLSSIMKICVEGLGCVLLPL